ncbi:hypothetical protein T492DRAFT_1079056 [Pavlovales sp. CCMP2436]|nr:hypothetical protein T492DRAFT_1079056 [Pavlovales sp. CCMP2436]
MEALRAATRSRALLRGRALRQLSTEGWHLLPEAGPSAEILRAVHTIMQEKAACPAHAVETTSLASDLGLKFKVLSACERRFNLAIPHRSLVELVDARTVAAYIDGALRAQVAVEKRLDEHWSKTLPSHVNMVGFTKKHEARNANLAELLIRPEQGEKIWNPATRGDALKR